MKRASTLDRKGRQSAEQFAEGAKAGIGKEENNVAADSKASGHPPYKKIKLGVKRDSASGRNASHSEETEQRPISPISSPRREAANAGQSTQSQVAAIRNANANASMPVLRSASSQLSASRECTGTLPASADTQVQAGTGPSQPGLPSPGTANASRRQQWIGQDKFSFVFDEITDPSLLALFDTPVAAGSPAAVAPQTSELERKRQLKSIADAIKAALESDLANVMRKFMDTGKQQGGRTHEYQAAHHAFCELMQMFNQAKVAAVDGQQAGMIAELQKICPALDHFIAGGLKDALQHFSGEKSEKAALKAGLRTLLAQCREWLGEDREKAVRAWSPSFAPSSPQNRQRSVSSPVRASASWTETESGKTIRLSASFSSPISPHPSQHRIGPFTPEAVATLSPTSTPPGSPLTSPVRSPKTVVSPKEGAKSFRLSAFLGSPGSPRAKEASRKDSSVKVQNRQSLLHESTSHSSLSVQQGEKPATPEKPKAEKSKKKLQ